MCFVVDGLWKSRCGHCRNLRDVEDAVPSANPREFLQPDDIGLSTNKCYTLIWACILLHGFMKFSSYSAVVLNNDKSGSYDYFSMLVPILIISVVAVCCGMFLLRKNKILEE